MLFLLIINKVSYKGSLMKSFSFRLVLNFVIKFLGMAPISAVLLTLVLVLFNDLAFGYGLGVSTYPLPAKSGALTTEFTSFLSNGSGVGLQARYLHKLSEVVQVEGSMGAASSDRSRRFALATDVELLSDFENRPRFALHPFIERATEFSESRNIIGIYPVLSKGYVFKEKAGYPFISVPISIATNTDKNPAQFRAALTGGIVGKLPFEFAEGRNLLVNLEGSLNISNSFSSLMLGLTYPL